MVERASGYDADEWLEAAEVRPPARGRSAPARHGRPSSRGRTAAICPGRMVVPRPRPHGRPPGADPAAGDRDRGRGRVGGSGTNRSPPLPPPGDARASSASSSNPDRRILVPGRVRSRWRSKRSCPTSRCGRAMRAKMRSRSRGRTSPDARQRVCAWRPRARGSTRCRRRYEARCRWSSRTRRTSPSTRSPRCPTTCACTSPALRWSRDPRVRRRSRRCSTRCRDWLAPGGTVVLELAPHQGDDMQRYALELGYRDSVRAQGPRGASREYSSRVPGSLRLHGRRPARRRRDARPLPRSGRGGPQRDRCRPSPGRNGSSSSTRRSSTSRTTR